MPYTEVNQSYLLSSSQQFTVNIPSSHDKKIRDSIPVPDDHLKRTIYCKNCWEGKTFVMNCGSRTCPFCRLKSIHKTLDRKGLRGKAPKDLRFMTLTIRSLPTLDRKSIDTIRGYFRRLIRQKDFKRKVLGGLYVIEVTHNQSGYHYHLHVIYQGQYYPQSELRSLWNKITENSYIVWISRIYDVEKSFDYVTKYISKIEKGNIDHTVYANAFKGIKLVQYFGLWTKLKSIPKKLECKKCGHTKWSIKPFSEPMFVSELRSNKEIWERICGKGPPGKENEWTTILEKGEPIYNIDVLLDTVNRQEQNLDTEPIWLEV